MIQRIDIGRGDGSNPDLVLRWMRQLGSLVRSVAALRVGPMPFLEQNNLE